MKDDLAAIKQWTAIFKDPTALVKTVTKNYLFHQKAIKADIAAVKTDWAADNFFKAGKDIADIAVKAIGPIKSTPAAEYGVDIKMIDHFLAGFIYGMTTQNHLTELEACYAGGETMEQEILASIKDFETGGWDNITQGVLEVLLVALQLPQELHTCESMQDDLHAIADWASIFSNKTKLIATLTKHYTLHKKAVDADIATLEGDWDNQKYFLAGQDVATLMDVLVGPIQ